MTKVKIPGALVSGLPGSRLLSASTALADARGRSHEVLWQGDHNKVTIITTVTTTFFNILARVIEDQEEKEEALVKFFCQNVHNKYSIYFFGFIGCEVLLLIFLMFVAVKMVVIMICSYRDDNSTFISGSLLIPLSLWFCSVSWFWSWCQKSLLVFKS